MACMIQTSKLHYNKCSWWVYCFGVQSLHALVFIYKTIVLLCELLDH